MPRTRTVGGRRREADVVVGVDVGGKYTKAWVEAADGRVGRAEAPTFQRSDSMTIPERVGGLVGSTTNAVLKALENGGVMIIDVDALGIGAPGARDPETGRYAMSNAVGRDETGGVAWVDFEGPLRQELERHGFRRDAVLRGANDCDIAAAARKLGKIVVLNEGRKSFRREDAKVKRVLLRIGTGIGGGVRLPDGTLDEGATGAMELGHGEVATTWRSLKCACGKTNEGSICIEAVASTTGQENVAKRLLERSFVERTLKLPLEDVENSFRWNDEVKQLLARTREWNQRKLREDISGDERRRLGLSIETINLLLEDGDLGGRLISDIVLDAGVIDELAVGAITAVRLCARAKEVAGEHFGRFLRASVFPLHNPGELVIDGGGAKTFDNGDREINPFWRAMMRELEGPLNDPLGSIKACRIIAAVGDENLGIQGSIAYAKKLYEQGGK